MAGSSEEDGVFLVSMVSIVLVGSLVPIVSVVWRV